MVASWMPNSPEECTATPSWNVSQTAAALTQARMPPQKVVSSRITSTAVSSTLAASCSKLTTTVLVASGTRTNSAGAAHAGQAVDGVFQIVVTQAFDALAEADGLLDGPDGVGVEAQGVVGESGGQGAVDFQFVIGVEDAGLSLVSGEAEALFERAGVGQKLVDGADFAFAGLGFG